jgi:hypothetical protein
LRQCSCKKLFCRGVPMRLNWRNITNCLVTVWPQNNFSFFFWGGGAFVRKGVAHHVPRVSLSTCTHTVCRVSSTGRCQPGQPTRTQRGHPASTQRPLLYRRVPPPHSYIVLANFKGTVAWELTNCNQQTFVLFATIENR